MVDFVSLRNHKYKLLILSFSTRLKAPRVPDSALFSEVIGDAFAIAIVGYAINISLGKTFALKHGYKVESNQVQKMHRSHTHCCTHKQLIPFL